MWLWLSFSKAPQRRVVMLADLSKLLKDRLFSCQGVASAPSDPQLGAGTPPCSVFFDPSEARDLELILLVHSASNRPRKRFVSLIKASSLLLRA